MKDVRFTELTGNKVNYDVRLGIQVINIDQDL